MISKSTRRCGLRAAIVLAVAATGAAPAGAAPACRTSGVFPGDHWRAARPSALGWDEERLRAAWSRAQSRHYSGGMLVHRGAVIGRFGDVSTPFQTRSIRKSLLNAVLGQLVASGRLKLNWTLGQLGIDDRPPLTAREKQATVRDLLMSRSGVYHDAAYAVPDPERPPRGAYQPGAHFWYNNWDFNALGLIAEKIGGASLFEQFERGVARPLQMEDYRYGSRNYRRDPGSAIPAYLFEMSVRDRARFGLLYLRHGCWAGRQVVPAQWADTSMAPLTKRGDELDYGYLWWSQRPVRSAGMRGRLIMARGNGNQYITLIPEADAVLVLAYDMDHWFWVNWLRNRIGLAPEIEDYFAVLKDVLVARPQRS